MINNQSIVKTPASCGELLQGVINEQFLLVPCPINFYSTVTVKIDDSTQIKCPSEYPKSKKAVCATLEYFSLDKVGAIISIKNPIPKSKGLGSSTADITSAIAATARATNNVINPEEIAKIAVSIEPSDATMFSEITAFAHQSGSIIETLGKLPTMEILAFDFGGLVDTIEYNKTDRFNQWKFFEHETIQAMDNIRNGIYNRSVNLIGKGATINAITSNKIVPNETLSQMIEFAAEIQSAGVSIAHSGTYISILLDPSEKRSTSVMKQAQSEFTDIKNINHFRTVSPGPIYI